MNNWEIKGLFYNCTARTNEEYKVELKKRLRLMVVFLLLGIVTLAVMAVLIVTKPDTTESYTAGVFCGIGIGLTLGSIMYIRNLRKTMNNDAALKEARLAETDEREQAISTKALQMTIKITLLSIYLLALLCSFITTKTASVLALLLAIFFLSYIISRKIYSNKM